MVSEAPITRLDVNAFTVPTDKAEADGTLEWSETTLVAVELHAGGRTGFGFTYGDRACADLVHRALRGAIEGTDAFATSMLWRKMRQRLRNIGFPGLGAMAVSAVDLAAWDLKARLLGVPLCQMLGRARDRVPVYGSGGFTSYSTGELCQQLRGWVQGGFKQVKMKIGREERETLARVRAAREAIGDASLFVDANGALGRKAALGLATQLAREGVTWFEEPVTADDVAGLRLIRDRAPPGMEIAAGEYLSSPGELRALLAAVDVVQADATRCGGVTGFLQTAALCQAFKVPLSAHTAPSMHLHACAAALPVRHLEYFHDHVRIEQMLLDGAVAPVAGALRPDLSRPGHGVELKRRDAQRFAV
jgi:L-alanine-DL-glutamate epimerase-like enolase superfamily enzyme